MKLKNYQVALIAVGAVAVGIGVSLLLGTDAKRGAAEGTGAQSIMLADPRDPPERRMPEVELPNSGGAPSEAPAPSSSALRDATSGERDKMNRSKEALRFKVESGNASEAEKRLLRALCRQLSDPSCSN